MASLRNRVVLYKKRGDGTWDSNGNVLGEARAVSVVEGIGTIRDGFRFGLLNAHNKYFKSFFIFHYCSDWD